MLNLTPSDRIHLISEIGRRLGTADWSLIDLTLRQFSLPTAEEWPGGNTTRSAYVVAMIESGNSDVLLDLGQHLGYEFGSARPQIEPDFWRNGYFRLFMSHLAKHQAVAGEIQNELLKFGVSSFVAHTDIQPTLEWQDEIETALATCDGMLVLLHPKLHQSKWADQEIGYAMGRKLLIVAARFGADPYGFIGRFQAMDGSRKTAEDLAEEMFDILCRHRQTRKRISEAVVRRFNHSDSFARAKANMALLEKLTYWNSSLSAQARSALKSNSQIRSAWDVPRCLERFISRMEKTLDSQE